MRSWHEVNHPHQSSPYQLATMDVFQSVSGYITKMVSAGDSTTTGGAAKMKVLLLDRDTVPIVSSATTQSALLNHSVYLTERIENQEREKMRHLRCLCFLRPSPDSIQSLIDEFREPRYGEYHICMCSEEVAETIGF